MLTPTRHGLQPCFPFLPYHLLPTFLPPQAQPHHFSLPSHTHIIYSNFLPQTHKSISPFISVLVCIVDSTLD